MNGRASFSRDTCRTCIRAIKQRHPEIVTAATVASDLRVTLGNAQQILDYLEDCGDVWRSTIKGVKYYTSIAPSAPSTTEN